MTDRKTARGTVGARGAVGGGGSRVSHSSVQNSCFSATAEQYNPLLTKLKLNEIVILEMTDGPWLIVSDDIAGSDSLDLHLDSGTYFVE